MPQGNEDKNDEFSIQKWLVTKGQTCGGTVSNNKRHEREQFVIFVSQSALYTANVSKCSCSLTNIMVPKFLIICHSVPLMYIYTFYNHTKTALKSYIRRSTR